MKTTLLALPLAVLLAARLAPPQGPSARATVLVLCAPGDVQLNHQLVNAVLGESECAAAVRSAAPAGAGDARITAALPANQAAGTFQILVDVQIALREPASDEQNAKIVDAAIAHLRKRVDAMLYQQPLEQAEARSAALEKRHLDLQIRHAELRARTASDEAALQRATKVAGDLRTQLANAQLEASIEERSRTQLDRMLQEQTARRDDCRSQLEKLAAQRVALEAKISSLNNQLSGTRYGGDAANQATALEQLRADIAETTIALRALSAAQDRSNERMNDVQRMLTIVFEQLPTATLALQRAQARVEVLHEQGKHADDELAVTEARCRESARVEAEAERVAIDIAVIKTLLLEVQGKLARLTPVQYQVLYAR